MSGVELAGVRRAAEDAALQEELRFVREHEREWATKHRGWFVLIGKATFAGFHRSYDDALRAGIRAFGPVAPFLVRKVGPQQ
jgi:hypothetical protein